jgi:hypothetical protein
LQARGGDEAMDLDTGANREHYFEVGYEIFLIILAKYMLNCSRIDQALSEINYPA